MHVPDIQGKLLPIHECQVVLQNDTQCVNYVLNGSTSFIIELSITRHILGKDHHSNTYILGKDHHSNTYWVKIVIQTHTY